MCGPLMGLIHLLLSRMISSAMVTFIPYMSDPKHDQFKIFKAKVENQHNAKIKIMHLDRGGEYYGRHTPYG
jgi:hypothetical protein